MMSQKTLKIEQYTVGWVCALPTEFAAAQAFLDATHNPPATRLQNDTNCYSFGQIGNHNVVLAVLPKGTYGTTSAAVVATTMRLAFPNINIGLMVGIGGGAPSPEHDIRLGDIVVSFPYQGNGGILQYDFGKAIQDKEFKVTGHLDSPPLFFQAALRELEAQYELRGNELEKAIDNALQKKPRLGNQYSRPDPNSDVLYLSQCKHPSNSDASCAQVCGRDPSKLVSRKPRTQNDDKPAIHYGTIASANRLMKDAVLRDKYAKENGVLCFEMEAAGLMDNFPCLVIRGICDYSDTHKNKDWQGYAALAAAAYAKDLLYAMPRRK